MDEKRPQIKIPLNGPRKRVLGLTILGLLVTIGLVVYYYGQLPDTIPRHYGADGQPDAYDTKKYLWSLPVIAVILYTMLETLRRYPHLYNYLTEITPQNAEYQYRNASLLMMVLNLELMWVFASLTYSTIMIALGHQSALGRWWLPIYLFLIFGTLVYFLVRMSRDPSECGI